MSEVTVLRSVCLRTCYLVVCVPVYLVVCVTVYLVVYRPV